MSFPLELPRVFKLVCMEYFFVACMNAPYSLKPFALIRETIGVILANNNCTGKIMTDKTAFGKLVAENTLLLIVDIQERLQRAMLNGDELLKNAVILLEGCKALNVAVIVSEQYPRGLGATVPALNTEECTVLEKTCFSCLDDDSIRQTLSASGCRDILLAGIESHVCVYQTARDLVDAGYNTHLVTDAVASRTAANCQLGISKIAALQGNGQVHLTGVETVLFDLLGSSRHPAFKTISNLVK